MINLRFLGQTPVAVLGLAKTGLPSIRALISSNVPVLAWDDNEQARHDAAALGATITDLRTANLSQCMFLLLSPGIPHTHPAPHAAVSNALKYKLQIIGDMELLYRAQPQAHYIGITGTNGKSTTTALLGHILQTAGQPIQMGGNLGQAVLAFDSRNIKSYVLEVSSYQIELCPTVRFGTACLLNITPDHLDRHGGMDGYVAAKEKIFARCEHAIIGMDDDDCRAIHSRLRAPNIIPISSTARQNGGIAVIDGTLYDDREGQTYSVQHFENLPGTHNAQNMAACYAMARIAGLAPATIIDAMQNFSGLAHRQQLVALINHIKFINDSKATNADAAAKALACYENIYWIIGGRAKETGLHGLESFAPRIRRAFIIGEASTQFAAWCQTHHIKHELCGTLENATTAAFHAADTEGQKNPVVLLSPAAASWDQFNNFEERGDVFTATVKKMATQYRKTA